MRHAMPEDLKPLAPMLEKVRAMPRIVERGAGRFYAGGAALLHFHEHAGALHADLKENGNWIRYEMTSKRDHIRLIAALRRVLRD